MARALIVGEPWRRCVTRGKSNLVTLREMSCGTYKATIRDSSFALCHLSIKTAYGPRTVGVSHARGGEINDVVIKYALDSVPQRA